MSAETTENQFQIDGDTDYVEHRREKAIFDAREMARDVILNAKREFGRGAISDGVLKTDARAAVEMYISEVEQIARKIGAEDILQKEKIHDVQLAPPDALLEFYENDAHRVLSDRPKPRTVATINGLWGYLTAPTVFADEWTIQVDKRHDGPTPVTKTATARMPVEASIDAFRFVNSFLARVGLDLEPRIEDYTGDEGPGL